MVNQNNIVPAGYRLVAMSETIEKEDLFARQGYPFAKVRYSIGNLRSKIRTTGIFIRIDASETW